MRGEPMETLQLDRLAGAVEALADVVEHLSRDVARGRAPREALAEIRADLAALRRELSAPEGRS